MGLILFFILFLLEILAFSKVGSHIGVLNTILVILLTAFIGGGQLKNALSYISSRGGNSKTEIAHNLFHAMCSVIGGFLLIIPGFVTDALGLLLLIPFVRLLLKVFLLNNILGRFTFNFVDTEDIEDMKKVYKKEGSKSTLKKGKIVEADFEVIDDKDSKK